MQRADLPMFRSHEGIDYKRCVKKWYWRWRRGLVPKHRTFGALELGTWVHEALALWYKPLSGGSRHDVDLSDLFTNIAESAVRWAVAEGAEEHHLAKAEELMMLGKAMMAAYQQHYRNDGFVSIASEIPIELIVTDEADKPLARYKLKPDLVGRFPDGIWLVEHKTAASIRTDHLVIDDQARPYGAIAETQLRKLGLLKPTERMKGVMYNFLRKGMPDERQVDEKGLALNKNGTVSKRQSAPLFKRYPVLLSRAAKAATLRRKRGEILEITMIADAIRDGRINPAGLRKTPHWSCPKTCDFFAMCALEEEGAPIKEMERGMFTRRNPYLYDEENDTADEPASFEMG
jgi:hypothetical protein